MWHCGMQISQNWFRLMFIACSASGHYLNQCWLVVNWTHWDICQLHVNRYTEHFFQGLLKLPYSNWQPYCSGLYMCIADMIWRGKHVTLCDNLETGGPLNVKTSSYQYRDLHIAMRPRFHNQQSIKCLTAYGSVLNKRSETSVHFLCIPSQHLSQYC